MTVGKEVKYEEQKSEKEQESSFRKAKLQGVRKKKRATGRFLFI